MDIIGSLKKGLIVSCQAKPGSPLRDPFIMAAMAKAAKIGGAVGIRANGPEDIAAIRVAVDLPIIGIYKLEFPDSDVYITPTLDSARQIAAAGADIIALDATARLRPGGLTAEDAIRLYQRELGLPVMADISTLAEGISAAGAGASLVATTLSGYTPYSRQLEGPDFDLISDLAVHLSAPIITEGRIATPAEAHHALELGSHAVVVGTAITAIDWVTQHFVSGMTNR